MEKIFLDEHYSSAMKIVIPKWLSSRIHNFSRLEAGFPIRIASGMTVFATSGRFLLIRKYSNKAGHNHVGRKKLSMCSVKERTSEIRRPAISHLFPDSYRF
jgi:hypothetical protein